MKKSNSYTIYRDMRGVYRWRLFAPNGRAIADSGEGYKRPCGLTAGKDRQLFAMKTKKSKLLELIDPKRGLRV